MQFCMALLPAEGKQYVIEPLKHLMEEDSPIGM